MLHWNDNIWKIRSNVRKDYILLLKINFKNIIIRLLVVMWNDFSETRNVQINSRNYNIEVLWTRRIFKGLAAVLQQWLLSHYIRNFSNNFIYLMLYVVYHIWAITTVIVFIFGNQKQLQIIKTYWFHLSSSLLVTGAFILDGKTFFHKRSVLKQHVFSVTYLHKLPMLWLLCEMQARQDFHEGKQHTISMVAHTPEIRSK